MDSFSVRLLLRNQTLASNKTVRSDSKGSWFPDLRDRADGTHWDWWIDCKVWIETIFIRQAWTWSPYFKSESETYQHVSTSIVCEMLSNNWSYVTLLTKTEFFVRWNLWQNVRRVCIVNAFRTLGLTLSATNNATWPFAYIIDSGDPSSKPCSTPHLTDLMLRTEQVHISMFL